MDLHLPEGWIGFAVVTVGNLVLLIWHVSSAMSKLKDHDKRLEKLEARVDSHAQKLDELMSELRERLARIETLLEVRAKTRT